MDFFLHGNNFCLTDCGVEVVLHFFLKLDLTLPEQNLSLCLHDFGENVGLLFLEVGNVVFKTDALVFELFELLFKLIFDVEVIIFKFDLEVVVLVEQVIQLVHFEVQVLLGHLQLSDFLLVTVDLRIQAQLLLLQNRLLGAQLLAVSGERHVGGLALNQVSLVRNPLFLNLNDFILELFSLLENVVLLCFQRSGVLVHTCVLQLSPDTVELVDLELAFVDSVVALLNVLLELLDLVLFLLKLSD